jgi:rhodanese-related sulfurtransferase
MKDILSTMTLDFFGQGKHKITPEKLFDSDNAFLLDVRSREESDAISIGMKCYPNVESANIPIHEVAERLDEIPRDRLIAVFCPAHVRATIVYTFLLGEGYPNVRILEGGYQALTDALKPGKIFKHLNRIGVTA